MIIKGRKKPLFPRSHPGPLRNWPLTLVILLGLAGLFLVIAGTLGWQQAAGERHQLQNLNRDLTAMFRQDGPPPEPNLSVEASRLGLQLPEADYLELYRQWQMAIGQFDRVAAALENRYLQAQAGELLQVLHRDLLALRDDATRVLEQEPAPPLTLSWRVHNLRGNVSVLLAYSQLYFEEDSGKAAKFLSDALDDYKLAIRQVDRVSLSSLHRILPRWNLELIVGIGEQRKTGLSDLAATDPVEIREQLQTFIPEVPGFSPGVPLETRVEK
ncbi:MAG: hypothetical protein R2940_00225 [Syntrophotaleaceae bacterium]